MTQFRRFDVSSRLQFRLDRERYGLYFVLLVAVWGVAIWSATGAFVEGRHGVATIYYGYFGAVFFLFPIFRTLGLLLSLPEKSVLVLEPSGLIDHRLSNALLPWDRIVDIRKVKRGRGRELLILELDDDLDRVLDVSSYQVMHQYVETWCRWKVAMTTQGLWVVGMDELHDAILNYWRAHSPYAAEAS